MAQLVEVDFDPFTKGANGASNGGEPALREVDHDPFAASPREVGFLESAGRTAGSAAVPVVRTVGLGAAGLMELAKPIASLVDQLTQAIGVQPRARTGLQAAQDAVFGATDRQVQSMRDVYDPKPGEQMSLPGQIAGGIASMPIEVVGGFGAQRGVERAADVVKRGGSLGEAATAGTVSGAANVAANLLPVKAGGAAGRLVERGFGGGMRGAMAGGALTGGVMGAAADSGVAAAENASLPDRPEFEDLQREADPAVSFGLGATFGAAGGRASRNASRARMKATTFDDAKREHGFVPDDQGRFETPSGRVITKDEWNAADVGEREALIKPKKLSKGERDEVMRLAAKAQEFGITLRPDQLSDNRFYRMFGELMEKVPGSGSKAEDRRVAFNKAVMKQIGADPAATKLTPAVFDDAISKAGQEIGEISGKASIPREAFGDLMDVARRETPDVEKVIRSYVDDLDRIAQQHGGVVPGDVLRRLRTEAASQARTGENGDVKRTLSALVDRLDDALEAHTSPDDMKRLADARRRYAVAKTIEPLVAKETVGDISPAALMGRVTADRSGKARMARGKGGEIGDLARIGKQFLKEPPSSGSIERAAVYSGTAATGLGAYLDPTVQAGALTTYGAANLYNRLGPKLANRSISKAKAKERAEGSPAASSTNETPPSKSETPAVKTETDPRLREIDRLREGASPETLKALDERAQQIRRELRQQELRAARDAEAKQLEATAAKTQDPELRAALIERANKLRAERIPVPEAKEVAEPAPTGRAPDIPKLPTPDVEPPPTGKAPDLPRLPVPVVREGDTAPTRARAEAPIPAPEAKELTTAEAASLRPTARERELVTLFERAADPEVRKDLQRLIEAERKTAEQRRRGEEYARLAREATDPELRASLQAKARKLGVDPDKEPEAPAARPDETIPTGEATELDYDQVLYSRSPMKSVEANVARGREAMNRALAERTTVHRAMHRTGLGWVDFEWGDDRRGVQHIIRRRMESDGMSREQATRFLTDEVVRTIAQGTEKRRSEVGQSVRVVMATDKAEASLVKNPGSNAWLLTGFELLPGNEGRGATPSSPSQTAPIRSRRGLGAGNDSVTRPEEARGPLPERPFDSPQALESSLRAKFGAKLIDGLVKRGVLHLGDGAPADVPRDARGRFTGKRAELYFDRLDEASAPAALMHEVGEHYGLPRMMGEKRYAELLGDLRKLRDQKEVKAAWEAVKRDYVNDDGTPSIPEGSDTFMREVAAQLVESAPNRPIVKRIVEAVRAWVYREFGVNLGRVDPGLLRGLATAALRKAARGELPDEPSGNALPQTPPAVTAARAEAAAEPPTQSPSNPVQKPEVGATTVADLLEAPEVASKLEPVTAAGLTAEDATQFLRALHAPERNRIVAIRNPRAGGAGSGMSNDEARRILARFTPTQRQVLDDLAKAAHREAAAALDAMVETGELDKRTRDFIRTNYRFYVPISSAKDAAAGRPIPATEAA